MAEFDILPPMECTDNMQFRRGKMLYEGNRSMTSATWTNMVMCRRLNHRRPLLFCLLDSSVYGLWKKYGYAEPKVSPTSAAQLPKGKRIWVKHIRISRELFQQTHPQT